MTDDLERRLVSAFRRADLPLAPDRLRDVLAALPSSAPVVLPRRTGLLDTLLRAAAALAVVLVLVGTVIYGAANLLPVILPGPTPSPSPTPTLAPTAPPTPTPAPSPTVPPSADMQTVEEMMGQHPTATILFERTVGPADRALSDDATLELIDLGRIEVVGDLVIAAVCRGPGEMAVSVRWLGIGGSAEPFPIARPCDGQPTVLQLSGLPGDEVEFQVLELSVPAGASWRLAVAELPDVPDGAVHFDPIAGTPGWWPLWDVEMSEPVQPDPGMGAGVLVPDDVTAIAVHVQCAGETSLTLTVVHDTPSEQQDIELAVACPTDEPSFVQLPVTAGEQLSIRATPDEPASIHLYVEADAMPVSTYEPAPEMPQQVANAALFGSNGSYVALGTLGGTRQQLVPIGGVGPLNRPGGGLVAFNVNTANGPLLALYSIADGERIAVLDELPPRNGIMVTWIDPLHEQVFYTVSNFDSRNTTLHRVGLDGSGKQVLGSAQMAEGVRTNFELTLDNTTFLIDACTADHVCHRQVIDAATLETDEVDIELGAQVCQYLGATDGIVAMSVGFSCQAFGVDETFVMAFDGTGRRTLPKVATGAVVRGSNGPQLVYRASLADAELQLMDLATGTSRSLGTDLDLVQPMLSTDLPPDWVLLAPWYGIGDFPVNPVLTRGQPPIVINIATGERIELVNQPH